MRNNKDNIETIIIKQIMDLSLFIKEIETMIALEKLKVKQVIWFPDNTWIWYNWN